MVTDLHNLKFIYSIMCNIVMSKGYTAYGLWGVLAGGSLLHILDTSWIFYVTVFWYFATSIFHKLVVNHVPILNK